MEDYRTDQRLAPQVREYLKGVNKGTPFNLLGAVKARQAFLALQNKGGKPDTSQIDIKSYELYGNLIHLVSPRGRKSEGVYFHIHGGGWVLQGLDANIRFIRDIVLESGMTAVVLDYPLSPEKRYPKALEWLYDAIKWCIEDKTKLNLDTSKIRILGNSVGGNMTWCVSDMLISDGIQVDCEVLCWPFMSNMHTYSWNEFGQDRYLTSDAMDWFVESYIPEYGQTMYNQEYIFPLLATDKQFKRTPKTYIAVAENDILRDCGEMFGHKLQNANVDVTVTRFGGMIHDWGVLNGLSEVSATKRLIEFITTFLKST